MASIVATSKATGNLPRCFYHPLEEGNSSGKPPRKEVLSHMKNRLGWLWGAEDHMQFCYEIQYDEIKAHDAKGDVFWKYGLRHAEFFCECLWKVAMEVVDSETPTEHLDALRAAARDAVGKCGSDSLRDCVHYVVLLADYLVFAKRHRDEYRGKHREGPLATEMKAKIIAIFIKKIEKASGFEMDVQMKSDVENYLWG